MDNLVWIISVILILTILSIVFRNLYSEKKRDSSLNNVIRAKKIFLIVGLLCLCILLPLTILFYYLDKNTGLVEKIIFLSIGLCFIVLLSGYLIFFYLNYKITVYDDYFVYQNFWRIKKKIYYKDIVINKEKLYPQIRLKKDNGKTKLVFKLAGILDNEEIFMETYKKWKNSEKSKINKNHE